MPVVPERKQIILGYGLGEILDLALRTESIGGAVELVHIGGPAAGKSRSKNTVK